MIRLCLAALLCFCSTGRLVAQDAPAGAATGSGAPQSVLQAGELQLTLERAPEGIRVVTLLDATQGVPFLPAAPDPLFVLVLRTATGEGTEVRLDAASGWADTEVVELQSPARLRLHWRQPLDPQLAGIRVTAEATADAAAHLIRWQLQVVNDSTTMSVWRVEHPRLTVSDLGAAADVFVPRGPGEVHHALWQREFQFRDTYPGAWMTMQFMAAYDPPRNTGIYVALHDPWGNTKDLAVESRPAAQTVTFLFDQPVENMGQAGNDFESCEVVWRLLRGDWYDAAVWYRDWVRAEATWHPARSGDARPDTMAAMRALDVWAVGGGDPWVPGGSPSPERVAEVERFAGALGAPVGMHWYRWHSNPFDNDYPHYLPAKSGFKEAVAQLQSHGVAVMPYINGRLWDTRDRGVEDFQFSSMARPYAAKDEQGEVVVEQYGSREADDTPVTFAVMCPATQFWQDRVYEITMRLYTDYGVKGVYIDQIAAATARLCFDPTHGHPLGGGHWWADGYRQMLDRIRQDMPRDCFLTTECNAEAYVRWFDGYLTWHWQNDGQVPAFPTVYGGALTMFGRNYAGGPTRDLALSMKVGQQLVFGEQLGWIDPAVVNEAQNLAFLRHVGQLRRQLKRYFDTGELARPPRLAPDLPTVRADWGWAGGNWWITTGALVSGAWRLPQDHRAILVFVNVGDQPVATSVPVDAAEYGLMTPKVRVAEIGADGPVGQHMEERRFEMRLSVPPRTALAFELTSLP